MDESRLEGRRRGIVMDEYGETLPGIDRLGLAEERRRQEMNGGGSAAKELFRRVVFRRGCVQYFNA